MVDFLDPAYYVGALAAVSTIVIGIIAIRNDQKKRAEEQNKYFDNVMSTKTTQVTNKIDEHIKIVDERFRLTETAHRENKEDIEDVEDEVKQMTQDFRSICDKLTRHEYVIDTVLPEFKILKEDFYKFKMKVDNTLVFRKKGSDVGNRENIDNDGEILK